MTVFGGAFRENACKPKCKNLTLSGSAMPNGPLSKDPAWFLAFEKDNPGLFDKSNDRYFENATFLARATVEYTLRNYKSKLSLVVTDENNEKTTKNVKIYRTYPDSGVVIAKVVNNGGTKHRRINKRRSIRSNKKELRG